MPACQFVFKPCLKTARLGSNRSGSGGPSGVGEAQQLL